MCSGTSRFRKMTVQDTWTHRTVLLNEAIAALHIQPDGHYIDATFGRGGHSRLILSQLSAAGRLTAFDKDLEAIADARSIVDPRFSIRHEGFSQLSALPTGRVAGILLDLGISSPQIDNPARGFSFRGDGPLDMRMDPSRGKPVADWLNTAPEAAIRECLWTYGEERKSRQIASRICFARQQQPIRTTRELAELVAGIVRHDRRIDPATRTFQALRIFINNELDELRTGLVQLVDALAVAGRIAVISFHSLEDRIVKRYFRELARDSSDRQESIGRKKYRLAFRKSLVADEAEVSINPRARSARLRVLERLA